MYILKITSTDISENTLEVTYYKEEEFSTDQIKDLVRERKLNHSRIFRVVPSSVKVVHRREEDKDELYVS